MAILRAFNVFVLSVLITSMSSADAEILASGVTEAVAEAALSVTAPGRVEVITVKEGQYVEKGDLLMYLDRELEALEIKRRELMLSDSSKLEELKSRESILSMQVQQAKSLLASGAVTRKQVEDESISWSGVVAERKALEFEKQREQVELDLARESYQRRHLYAPFAGIITKIMVRPGESIETNAPAMYLMDTSRIRFVGTFSALSGIEPTIGQRAVLRLGHSLDSVEREATITFVSPAVDSSSGLIELVAEIDNLTNPIRPGAIGQLVLQGD